MEGNNECILKYITKTPASKLINLPLDELENLTLQIEEIVENAALALNWLTLMKIQKETRERESDRSKGGLDEEA